MSTRFIITREHRRFTEFADAVRRSCTIGLCFGPAGVGKTLSARRYAHWEQCHQLLTDWGPRTDNDAKIYAALARRRTVLYTPSVLTTARALKDELDQAISRTNICIEQHLRPAAADRQDPWDWRRYTKKHVQLIIVDESERLAHTAMELLRDWYDRDNIALILIGMPWDDAGLLLFIRETRRAELGHWWALGASPVFLLWNPPLASALLVAYGVGINLPFIAIQRYNRQRAQALLTARTAFNE